MVRCRCGKEFEDDAHLRMHSIILGGYRQVASPDHFKVPCIEVGYYVDGELRTIRVSSRDASVESQKKAVEYVNNNLDEAGGNAFFVAAYN